MAHAIDGIVHNLQTPQEAFLIRTREMIRQYREKLARTTSDDEQHAILKQLQEWEQQLEWGGKSAPKTDDLQQLKQELTDLKLQLQSLAPKEPARVEG